MVASLQPGLPGATQKYAWWEDSIDWLTSRLATGRLGNSFVTILAYFAGIVQTIVQESPASQ
jgi:hypothetical protein